MKLWSHMFAVNAHIVSTQKVNWNVTSQFTQTSKRSVVGDVVKISSVNIALWNTRRDVVVVCRLILAKAGMSNIRPAGQNLARQAFLSGPGPQSLPNFGGCQRFFFDPKYLADPWESHKDFFHALYPSLTGSAPFRLIPFHLNPIRLILTLTLFLTLNIQ